QIFDQALEKPECAGMGTTLALALFQDNSVVFAHVGDSRIYRLRGGELTQITSDHSLVQELVDNGYLSEEEARLSVSRNLITRALGIAENVEADVRQDETETGDLYLLCSDGLSDLVNDDDLKDILEARRMDMESAAKAMVDLANQKGGTDNISVILVSIEEAYSDEQGIGAR
ncbi:MAG: serine/threonine-protein phosphatase, partial [Pseudomonadota bacterium]